MRLGTRLREIRAARNLTQKDMATQLNISRSTYAHYELGSREPDIETLKSISSILNVSLDYLSGNTTCPQKVDKLLEYLSLQAKSHPDLRISDLDLKKLD
ncbi:MAG: helix-turn-helix transcriptional regulator [Clostridiaceae bacterium]|nr:helix-turn-helix transcriptional regulator [Clostridiaceae bacterium]